MHAMLPEVVPFSHFFYIKAYFVDHPLIGFVIEEKWQIFTL